MGATDMERARKASIREMRAIPSVKESVSIGIRYLTESFGDSNLETCTPQ